MTYPNGKVFISYAHVDNESAPSAAKWLDRVLEHLRSVELDSSCSLWSDQDIPYGDNWHAKIQQSLKEARVAILMVSSAFLQSKYIRQHELPPLLEMARTGKLVAIPLIIRPCAVMDAVFRFPDPDAGPHEASLAQLQSPTTTDKALSSLQPYEQDRILAELAGTIKRLTQSSSEAAASAANSGDQSGETAAATGGGNQQTPGGTFNLPGSFAARGLDQKAKSRRLLYERVPVQGFLSFDKLVDPYEQFHDATDSDHHQPTICGYAWFPHTTYLVSPSIQEFTPAAIVCTLNPQGVVRQLADTLGESDFSKLLHPPRHLRTDEKAMLLRAMGSVLGDCFEVAVTFPKLILEVGHERPKMAYELMVNGFLLPFVRMHKRLGYSNINFEFSTVGEMDATLLGFVKRVFRVCYPRGKRSITVDLAGQAAVATTMCSLARLFAWTVGTLHNSGNSDWIEILEQSVARKDRGSSHLEEPL